MKLLKYFPTALVISSLFFFASSALADHHMAKAIKVNAAKLSILTNAKGMTLYTFDKDQKSKSNCSGGCAKKWPPFLATNTSKGKGKFTVINRADGTKQWAYKSQPLYFWFKDKKQGDVTGDGVKGVWHVARP